MGCEVQYNLRPSSEDGFRNMKLPVHLTEEGSFVEVDLANLET
jgi:hypothetical protein